MAEVVIDAVAVAAFALAVSLNLAAHPLLSLPDFQAYRWSQ